MKNKVLVVAGLVLGLARPDARAAEPADPLAGYHRVWEAELRFDGAAVTAPRIPAGQASRYRLLVSGVVDTGTYGTRFDALYATTQAHEFRLRHEHLQVTPPGIALVHGDRSRHRYVFALADAPAGATRLAVRLDGLPRRFLLSPERLARISRGRLTAALYRRGRAPGRAFPVRWIVAGVAFLLALGSLVWLRRRDRAPGPAAG